MSQKDKPGVFPLTLLLAIYLGVIMVAGEVLVPWLLSTTLTAALLASAVLIALLAGATFWMATFVGFTTEDAKYLAFAFSLALLVLLPFGERNPWMTINCPAAAFAVSVYFALRR